MEMSRKGKVRRENMNMIVERFPSINYVLLKRKSDFMPWIAAWKYCDTNGTWGQGHYFNNKEDALEYIDELLKEA